jgi:TRAP transporter TAXI family solute receptor
VAASVLALVVASRAPAVRAEAPPADTAPHAFFTVAAAAGDPVAVEVAGGICRLLSRRSGADGPAAGRPWRCAVQQTGGTADSLRQLRDGRVGFALVPAPAAAAADAGGPLTAVLALYAEPLHVVVGRDVPVAGVGELQGRRLSFGAAASPATDMAERLLAAAGVDTADRPLARDLTPARQVQALCAGDIDAFAVATATPSVIVARATDGCGARLLPAPAAAVARVVAAMPGTRPAVIPRGTYATTAQPVPTVAAVMLLAAAPTSEPAAAAAIARVAARNQGEVRGLHPALAGFGWETMFGDGIPLTVHPAVRAAAIAGGR